MMRVFSTTGLVCVTAFSAATLAQTAGGQTAKPPAPKGAATAAATGQQSLSVTVKYTGKGVVDETHALVIALLPTPTVSSSSRPLAMLPVSKNGGVASFTNVSTSPVYVLAIYDDKGTWNPQAGPPPAGTPTDRRSSDSKKDLGRSFRYFPIWYSFGGSTPISHLTK